MRITRRTLKEPEQTEIKGANPLRGSLGKPSFLQGSESLRAPLRGFFFRGLLLHCRKEMQPSSLEPELFNKSLGLCGRDMATVMKLFNVS